MPFCKHGCEHIPGSRFFLSRGFARKVQENKFCFDLYWVFPHIMLYHDNDMSSENPIWLLTQIHRVGMEGTELFKAACSFLHMSRSMRSGADLIFGSILGHWVVFFFFFSSDHVLLWWQLDSGSVVYSIRIDSDIYPNIVTALAVFGTHTLCDWMSLCPGIPQEMQCNLNS